MGVSVVIYVIMNEDEILDGNILLSSIQVCWECLGFNHSFDACVVNVHIDSIPLHTHIEWICYLQL